MTYIPQTWSNGVLGGTPINAARLQYMENGIANPLNSIPDGTFLSAFDVSLYGALFDGSDETVPLQLAVNAAIAAGGGKVVIPTGKELTFNGPITADQSFSVVIEGGSGERYGSKLTCTYDGSDNIISAKSSVGFTLRYLEVNITSTAADGFFLDLSHDTGPAIISSSAPVGRSNADTFHPLIDSCIFTAPANAALKAWIKPTQSIVGRAILSTFVGARRAIDTYTADYCNVWTVNECVFHLQTLRPINLMGSAQSWTISENTFEGLADSSSGALDVCQTGATGYVYTLHYNNNWHGDTVGGTWCKVGGTLGSSFNGNYFGSGAVAIQFTTQSQGLAVQNNRGDAGYIDFGPSDSFIHLGIIMGANDIPIYRAVGHRVGDNIGFQPITAPKSWFMSDAIPTQAEGSPVVAWPDRGSSDLAAVEATNRPTYHLNRLNTLPGVRFTGTQKLATAAYAVPVAQPLTVFLVAEIPVLAGIQIFFDSLTNTSPLYVSGGNWILYAGSAASDGAADTSPHIFCATYNGASSNLRVDGGAGTVLNPGTAGFTGITLGNAFAGTNPLVGYLYHQALIPALLALDAINEWGFYLADKYDLSWTIAT